MCLFPAGCSLKALSEREEIRWFYGVYIYFFTISLKKTHYICRIEKVLSVDWEEVEGPAAK